MTQELWPAQRVPSSAILALLPALSVCSAKETELLRLPVAVPATTSKTLLPPIVLNAVSFALPAQVLLPIARPVEETG